MYLIGASGHAKVIVDILKSNGIEVSAFIDKNEAITTFFDKPVYREDFLNQLQKNCIISIGNNSIRKRIAEQFKNLSFISAIHSSAIISNSVQIQEGTVVMHGSVIQADSVIGKHVIINTMASVDHDNVIEDYVHIAPGVRLCGGVSIGEGSILGVGTVVIPGIKIGKWCTIGAGSVIVKDIPDHSKVYGNPGRIIV